jgi:hypothetical protein
VSSAKGIAAETLIKQIYDNDPWQTNPYFKMKNIRRNQMVVVLALSLTGVVGPATAQSSGKFNQMAQELHLTETQKSQLAPILQEEKKQTEALKSNNSLGKRAKLQKYMQIQQHSHYQASQVLNEKQLAGLEEMQKEQRRQMMQNH